MCINTLVLYDTYNPERSHRVIKQCYRHAKFVDVKVGEFYLQTSEMHPK